MRAPRDRAYLTQNWRRVLTVGLVLFVAWRLVILADQGDTVRASCDGGVQWDMAVSLVEGHGFSVRNEELLSCSKTTLGLDPDNPTLQGGIQLGPSHHYGPFLALFDSLFILLLGNTVLASKAMILAMMAITLGSLWWTTRDLLGQDAALLVTGWGTVNGTLLLYGYRYGYAEPLVLALMAWTLWAILRSLESPRFILWAGLFAGLGYLTKSSVGWFFLIAGLGGVLWRLFHRGGSALVSRPYPGAIAIFWTLAGSWMVRNTVTFWDRTLGGLFVAWQTSPYNSQALALVVSHPPVLAWALAVKLPVLLLPLVALALPLRKELVRGLREWRKEDVSLLLVSAGLLFFIGWMFSAASFAVEHTSYLWPDSIRYTDAIGLCVLWLALAYTPGRVRIGAWAVVALVAFLGLKLIIEVNHAVAPPLGSWPNWS